MLHWGLFLSFLSIHIFELIFSDNQGNGTVSKVLAIIMWPLSGSRGVVTCCVTHIWRTTFYLPDAECPFFTLLLDLLTYAKQTNHQETKRQRKKQKDWKCHQLWLYSWTKGGLGKHNKRTDKGGEVENGFRQWETLNQLLFQHFSLGHIQQHMHPELHTWQSKTKTAQLCFSVALGWRERKWERKREKEQLLVGVDRAAPVPHRQMILERTHHLCSFVELSHFNPQPGLFGNQLHNPPPSTEPQSRSPAPPAIQPCSCQHFHLCAAEVWCQVYPHKHTFTKATPTTGLPHVCQEQQVGWRGRGVGLCDVLSVLCALCFYCYLRE